MKNADLTAPVTKRVNNVLCNFNEFKCITVFLESDTENIICKYWLLSSEFTSLIHCLLLHSR